ncbi:MAG: glycosyltransferase [Cyclobacteriaceae bacterium]
MAEKKKILLVNDFWQGGGAETVFRKTFDLLKGSGEFIVDRFVGFEKYQKSEGIIGYLFSAGFKKKLTAKLEAYQPDVIHFHGYYHVLSPSVFRAIKKYKKNNEVKVFYTAHDYHFLNPHSSLLKFNTGKPEVSDNIGFPKWLFDRVDHRGFIYSTAKKLQWTISHLLLRNADVIDVFVSPSIFLKELYEKHLGVKVELIRNPIPEAEIKPMKKLEEGKTIKMIYLGRLSEEKGIAAFVRKLYESGIYNQFKLDIYGDGELHDSISEFISANDLSEHIELKGFVQQEQLKEIIARYDVVAIPSICHENAPMSIVESSFDGLYILGSTLGGVPELAKICGNYHLFDPFDEQEYPKIPDSLRTIDIVDRTGRLDGFFEQTYLEKLINLYQGR